MPFTDITVPMPSTEIMTAAGTTAVISVAATHSYLCFQVPSDGNEART